MNETREQYQKRIAAWAQREYRSAAIFMAARQDAANARAAVFTDPNASLAEVAAAALEQSGVSETARANMSAAATAREQRKKITMPKTLVDVDVAEAEAYLDLARQSGDEEMIAEHEKMLARAKGEGGLC